MPGAMVAELPRLWLKQTPVNTVHGTDVVGAGLGQGKRYFVLDPASGLL